MTESITAEALPIRKRLAKLFSPLSPQERQPKEDEISKARMIYELVPALYRKGMFDQSGEFESFLNDTETNTKLTRKTLLDRAISDITSEEGFITFQCQRRGQQQPFSRFSTTDEKGLMSPTVVINADHPALNFSLAARKRNKEGGIPFEPSDAQQLFTSLIAAQVFVETHHQTELLKKQGTFR